MSVINTNVMSLNAQRNLTSSQNMLQNSLQRLSSGLRINSAKDDAAGLAISERFSAQIRGMNQAVRNANDGISYAQTAEGALGEISNQLQRIRELAVQSANETNTASDRESLNNEVRQAVSEINRIASTSQFNGKNILDGALGNLTFQVGANAGQTINVGGVDSRGNQLGAVIVDTRSAAGVSLGAEHVSDELQFSGAKLDFSSVDLVTTDLTGQLKIGNRVLSLDVATSALTDPAEAVRLVGSSIETAIKNDAVLNLDDYEVKVNSFNQSIEIINKTEDKVNISSDLSAGAAVALAGAATNVGAATVNATNNQTAASFGGDTLKGSTNAVDFTVEMTLGDRTVTVGYTDTTSATGADGGTALKTFLQDQFRAAFADIEGAENIAVTFEGTNAFKLVNTTTESGSFKISGTSGATNIDVTTGITAATITGTSVNFDYTNATTADITTGVKGSVAVTGVGTFDIDLPQGSTGVDLAAAVQTGLKDLGVNANVEILGGNLKITNFERSAVEIDFSAVTDGTNQVFVNKDVAGATIESLSDYLGKGNTATFTAEINGEGFEIKDARSLTDVVNGINQRSGETGVKASLSANGQDIFFSSERGTDFDAKLDVKVASVEINRDIAATAEDNTVLADQFSVATLEDANRTLLVADYALDQVNSLRGELGAIQNRFEAAISNLRVGSENLSAANSRIRDADFAAETAELTRAQILQQAGTTVLAQANQIPNSVLALLQ